MRLNQYFQIEEFVPRDIFTKYGESSTWFLDPRMIEFMLFIRKRYGKPVIVNNWHSGGQFENRGFRPPASTVGAKLSQHRYGRACDFNVHDMAPNETRADILKHPDDFIAAGLTTIEHGDDAPTWVHADCRWTKQNSILVVRG